MKHVAAMIALAASAAAGCAVGPDFEPPAAPKVTRFTSQEQPFHEGGKLAGDWWRLFECPPLDAIVHEAIRANPSLQAAQASLAKSQDSLRAGCGVFFPQANGSAGALRQKFSPATFGQSTPGNVFSLFTLEGTVSYALDLWGGERRSVEALAAQRDAARFTMLGTFIMLTGNVVDAVVARAAYAAEIDATRQLIELQKEQVHIADVQARAGTAPYANVLSVASTLAATQATLPPLEQKIDQAAHLLAALSGHTPAEGTPQQIALADLKLPRDLPVSLPSQLVRQRPDILEAEAELHAASAQIGVATAAMLPSLTLTGSYGVGNNVLGNLLSPESEFWSFGAGLTAPVFRGGTLYYQRRAAVDAFRQASGAYRQTVLSAFEQIADTLRGLDHDADAIEAETVAVQSADAALHLLQANYAAGIATYLQVLVADQQYLQAKIAYVQAVAQRLQDTVALYVALGGGWWNDGGKR